MRKQFVSTIENIFREDKKIFLLLGDIGVFGFRDVLSSYPDRAKNIGILEQSMISLASGLSMAGFFPTVHTIAPFISERALEQIKVDLCYQNLPANLVAVGGSYDYSALGPTHHCPGDVGVLNELPGMEIIIPGSQEEFDYLFRERYNCKIYSTNPSSL